MDVKKWIELLPADAMRVVAAALPEDIFAAEAERRKSLSDKAGRVAVEPRTESPATTELARQPEFGTPPARDEQSGSQHGYDPEVLSQFERFFDQTQTTPYSLLISQAGIGGVTSYRGAHYSWTSAISPRLKQIARLDIDINSEGAAAAVKEMSPAAIAAADRARDDIKIRNKTIFSGRGDHHMFYQDSPRTAGEAGKQEYLRRGVTEMLSVFPAECILGTTPWSRGVSIVEYTTLRDDYSPGGDNRTGHKFAYSILLTDEDAAALFDFLKTNPALTRTLGDKLVLSANTITASQYRINESDWRNEKLRFRPPYKEWRQANGGESRIAFQRGYHLPASEDSIIAFQD